MAAEPLHGLRATRAGAYIRASRAPRGGAGGIGAAEPLQGQASRYGGWRIYTRFALRGLAHIYALCAHHGISMMYDRYSGEGCGGCMIFL